MKRTLAAAALLFSLGCRDSTPLQEKSDSIDLYELTTGCDSSGKSELELRILDVTEKRMKYRKGGPYPYTNADGICKNIQVKEGSDVLYVVDVNPEGTVKSFAVTLDGKALHSGWPYTEEKGSYPYTEMDLFSGMKKGKHVLSVEVLYENGNLVKKSLEISVN